MVIRKKKKSVKIRKEAQKREEEAVGPVLWPVYTAACKLIQDGVWSLPGATTSKSQTASEVTVL